MSGMHEQPYQQIPEAGATDQAPVMDRVMGRRGFVGLVGKAVTVAAVTETAASCALFDDPEDIPRFDPRVPGTPYNNPGPKEAAEAQEKLPGRIEILRNLNIEAGDYVADVLDARARGKGVPWQDQLPNGEWLAESNNRSGTLLLSLRYRELEDSQKGKGYETVTATMRDTRGDKDIEIVSVMNITGGVGKGEHLSQLMRDPGRVVPKSMTFITPTRQGGAHVQYDEVNAAHPQVDFFVSNGGFDVDAQLLEAQRLFAQVRG